MFEQENLRNNEQLPLSQDEITETVVAALLSVYDSKGNLDAIDIAQTAQEITGYSNEACDFVVQKLYEAETPYLQMSKDPNYKTMLGAAGLWLVEDSFMHGEDNVDSMAIAKRNLGRFFSFLKS